MQPAPVLHLLCFDLPVPPLYGGTEELDTKIRILLDLGVALHVHAFVWPKDLHSGKMPDWHQRVASLRCYPRRWMVGPYDARPWALISRTSSELIHNLASEPGPVLVEGWQCADLLRAPALKNRVIWIRSHNIESNYYRMQAESARGWVYKAHYRLESWRWILYEGLLPQRLRQRQNAGILSICPSETSRWSSLKLPAHYVPAFVNLSPKVQPPNEERSVLPMQAPYALYHGRLDIAENFRAVRFLLLEAAIPKQVPLVIAGSRIPDSLRKTILLQEDCHLVDTPSPSEMQRWIQHAAVHCIPCYGMAGLRLKIIHAMMGDGHVLVSREGVQGMPWAAWLTVVQSEQDWEDQVQKALEKPLQADEVAARHAWVLQHFDQRANALKILDLMGIIPS